MIEMNWEAHCLLHQYDPQHLPTRGTNQPTNKPNNQTFCQSWKPWQQSIEFLRHPFKSQFWMA